MCSKFSLSGGSFFILPKKRAIRDCVIESSVHCCVNSFMLRIIILPLFPLLQILHAASIAKCDKQQTTTCQMLLGGGQANILGMLRYFYIFLKATTFEMLKINKYHIWDLQTAEKCSGPKLQTTMTMHHSYELLNAFLQKKSNFDN